MDPIDSNLRCAQCGGDLASYDGQLFFQCPYCESALFMSKGKIVFHWYLEQVFDQEQSEASLARWLSKGNIGVDLWHNAQITQSSFAYFPFWMIRNEDGGSEEIMIEPAAATSVTEIRSLHLPGGNFLKYSEEIDALSLEPSIPLNALFNQLDRRGINEAHVAEIALIHLPIHTFKYTHRNREYMALVEGSSGKVFSNIHPEKTQAPYIAVSLVTALTFICLATFPCLGGAIDKVQGRSIGLALCSGMGALFAIAVVAVAGWLAGER